MQTTCLQQKRDQVLKLWQQNLQSKDPILLSKIEETNRLALEAAQKVEHLKKSIHALQSITTDELTPQQTKQLDDLRTQVLFKLSEFEEMNEEVNALVSKHYLDESKAENKCTQLDETPGNSQVEDIAPTKVEPEAEKNKILTDQAQSSIPIAANPTASLIVLKERTSHFNADDTDEDQETDGIMKMSYPSSVAEENEDYSSATATSVDLSRLAGMYEEPLSFPKLKAGKTVTALNMADGDKCKGADSKDKCGTTEAPKMTGCCRECKVYRKLAQQQKQEVMQVRMDLERVESEAMFQMRVLKSKLAEPQIQGLNMNPYMLPGVGNSPRNNNATNIWDKKLQQYAQTILDSKLKDFEETIRTRREEEVCDAVLPKQDKIEDGKMAKEIEMLREKLKAAESVEQTMKQELDELKKENNTLRL